MAEQNIIIDAPPMYDEMAAVFPIRNRQDVIFSWGDRIYNPHDVVIPPELLVHEAIHCRRQGANEQHIRDWWKRYLEDPIFRLIEETVAHRAEYQWFLDNGNRRQRRAALKQIAQRLASPLYGSMISQSEAKRQIQRVLAHV